MEKECKDHNLCQRCNDLIFGLPRRLRRMVITKKRRRPKCRD
jgi:hypothetical protein